MTASLDALQWLGRYVVGGLVLCVVAMLGLGAIGNALESYERRRRGGQ